MGWDVITIRYIAHLYVNNFEDKALDVMPAFLAWMTDFLKSLEYKDTKDYGLVRKVTLKIFREI